VLREWEPANQDASRRMGVPCSGHGSCSAGLSGTAGKASSSPVPVPPLLAEGQGQMELPGASYFFTLATVSITFVGFSTLFTIFRQVLGGKMSKYDVLLTRNFLQLGFIVTSGALLPPLLGLFAASPGVIRRVSSLLTAVLLLIFVVTYPSRRRAATGSPMPNKIWINLSIQCIAAGVLLVNAAGVTARSGVALHALGVTIVLFSSFIAFLNGLDLLLTEPARPVDEQPKDQ
jgi:hypothetical protein